MKNPFRIRTRVYRIQFDEIAHLPDTAHWIVEYRRWWQFSYRPLWEGYCPMIFLSKEAAFNAAKNIKYLTLWN